MLLNLNIAIIGTVAGILKGISALITIGGTLGLINKKWNLNELLKNAKNETLKNAYLENQEVKEENNIESIPPAEPTPMEPAEPNAGMLPSIQDETNRNIEQNINFEDILKKQEELMKQQWEREDQIRKETQKREDNALQRAVADARKAGINPNLINLQPAASGGGITQASGLNYSLYQGELEKYLTEWENLVNNELKLEEGQKDRLTDTINQIISLVGMYFIFGGKK